MGIRKFKGDYLFTGKELLPPGAVLITDDYGIVTAISNAGDAGEGIEEYQGIISPGFVNTHCHIELSHMKGKIPSGTGLIEFLTSVIKERNSEPDLITNAMQLAEAEMYNNGVVAVGDICNTTDSMRIKQNSRISCFNFLEVMGFHEQDAEVRINDAVKFLHKINSLLSSSGQLDASHHAISVVPHAPYSVSKKLFGLINGLSRNQVITIHNQESEPENQLYRSKSGPLFDLYKNLGIDASSFKQYGNTSLQTYLPWLNKAASIILVHNTFTNQEDLVFVHHNSSAKIYFCICINANRYIESVNPPLELLREQRCTITVGTDSYASNTQLSILEEVKMICQEFPYIPLPEILQWATLNGAKALGMDSKLGSFDTGKQPGIVLISHIVDQHVSMDSTSKRLL